MLIRFRNYVENLRSNIFGPKCGKKCCSGLGSGLEWVSSMESLKESLLVILRQPGAAVIVRRPVIRTAIESTKFHISILYWTL